MATAEQVIKSALQRILVQASEARLEPAEYQDAIFDMNNMVLAWDAEGIQLGYTEVNNLADEVTVPIGALRGLIANLAIEVAPDYNGKISAGLIQAAERGMNAIRQLGQSIPSSRLPCTLPIGSGNEGSQNWHRYSHFYPCEEAEILAETTGAISLEIGTDAASDGTVPVPASTFTFLDDNDVPYVVGLAFLDDNDNTYVIPDAFLDDNDVSYAL